MVERNIDVIVAGHVCLDIIPGFPTSAKGQGTDVFTPGRLVEVDQPVISTGGPVSNTGIPLAKLGMKVAFMAKVGDDHFADLIIEKLGEWADTSRIAVSVGEDSSYTAVIAPPDVDRIFFHCPGANHTFSPRDIDFDLCARAKVFHLGYPPLMRSLYENDGELLVEIFQQVKGTGATTSLDMALPDPSSEAGQIDWRRNLERVLPYTDVFHPSAEEGLYMFFPDRWRQLHEQAGGEEILDWMEAEDFERLAGQALEWGAAVVTIKAGHRGFYLQTGSLERLEKAGAAFENSAAVWSNRQLWSPAYKPEKIASATGAGDCSLAGFTAAYTRGESPERSVAAAGALGYQNLQVLDATSGIGDWATTQSIFENLALPRADMPDWKQWRFALDLHLGFGPANKE